MGFHGDSRSYIPGLLVFKLDLVISGVIVNITILEIFSELASLDEEKSKDLNKVLGGRSSMLSRSAPYATHQTESQEEKDKRDD
ncbi:hypothetical protein U1Q18_025611, partial [Sarracenia purpurea var. burkii]